jgi:hypothetical protein
VEPVRCYNACVQGAFAQILSDYDLAFDEKFTATFDDRIANSIQVDVDPRYAGVGAVLQMDAGDAVVLGAVQ